MHTRRTAIVAALLALLPAAATGQSIQGTVVDEADEQPLEGVRLVVYDQAGEIQGETLSDEEGWFGLPVPGPGAWVLAADVIGYGDLRTEPVEVGIGEQVTVKVRMAVQAIALEPLVVTGRVNYLSGDLQSFYRRMDRGRRSGLGDYISRADIDDRGPLHPTDLFRGRANVRTVRGRGGHGDGLRMAGGCVPAIFIDGTQINRFNPWDSLDDYVAVHSIEGVEIYRGSGAQVERFHDPGGCGLILVWTRRGLAEGEGKAFSWKRLGVGVALLGAIFLLR